MSETTLMPEPLMKKRDVAKFFQCSERQVELMVKAGKVPRPIYISDSSPRWRHSDLMAWLDRLQADDSPECQAG